MKISHVSPCVCVFCGFNACYDELPICEDCASRFYSMLRVPCKSCGKTCFECDCPKEGNVKYLFFFGSYDSKRIIYTIKNEPERRMVDFFADMMIQSMGITSNKFDVVTFVPRRKKAVKFFGFDQSKNIARSISRKTGIPLVDALERKGNRQQRLLSFGERVKDIKDFYGVKYIPKEKYKRILLVDDVVTTGATMKCCSELLRKDVANSVFPIAVAKTNFSLRKIIDF